MLTPPKTVLTFLAEWQYPGGLDKSFRDYFMPATVWENVGVETTTGADEAIALNAQLGQAVGIATIWVDTLAIETTVTDLDHKVLTERVDHLFDGGGALLASAKVMGVFEVADGKITAPLCRRACD